MGAVCCGWLACAFSSATARASIALLSASMVESRRARSASTKSFQLALSAACRSALAKLPHLADKCNAAKIEFRDGKFVVCFADSVDNLVF